MQYHLAQAAGALKVGGERCFQFLIHAELPLIRFYQVFAKTSGVWEIGCRLCAHGYSVRGKTQLVEKSPIAFLGHSEQTVE